MANAIDDTPSSAVKPGKYEDLLEEMLRRWTYATDRWRPIRTEAKIDMQYVSGNPWEEKDRRAREGAGRPVGSYDELSQYTNQVVNDIRQHKRAIQVTPIGEGANDHTARTRQQLFRQIEYRSNAQQAYTCAFQNMVERSYGFVRVKSAYCDNPTMSGGTGAAFDQELLIDGLVSPDLVTVDPDIVKPDGSDMQYAWIAETWDLDRYKRKFPKAKIRDFSSDLAKAAPTWMDARRIRIAEYFNIELKRRCLYLFSGVDTNQGRADIEVFEDDLRLPEFKSLRDATPDRERFVDVPSVKIYLTNGFEVLEPPKDWPGQTIPIVCFFGKILYVEVEGEGAQKQILSMVRLARDPFMLYCYIRACEQELVGMTPKVPYFVRKGSLDEENKLNLQKSLHEPIAVIEVDGRTDHMPDGTPPEFPVRQTYEPAIQALEALAEAMRRGIQSAMAISPLPTQAQRINQKSGKALQEIHDAEQQGSFHFVDNYEMGLTRVGAILNEVCPVYYDTARTITVRTPSDEVQLVRINDTDPDSWPKGQTAPIDMALGRHDVTLSAGPSFDSEREAANDFADTLTQEINALAPVIGNAAASKLLSLAVKLKNLGPIGDDIAALLSPPDPQNGLPPQVQQAMQGLQQENQQLKQAIQTKQVEIQAEGQRDIAVATAKAQLDRAGKSQDNATKLQIADMTSGRSAQASIIGAELKAGNSDAERRIEILELMLHVAQEERRAKQDRTHDAFTQAADHAHAVGQQVIEHAHERVMAHLAADHAAASAQQQADLAPPQAPQV